MAGELSNVKSSLESAYQQVFDDNPNLGERLRQAVDDDTIDSYKSAYDQGNAQDALASAAANGDLSDDYSNVYNRFPELRQAVKEAGRKAFSDSDKRELAEAASSADISRLYTLCVTGELAEAASALNLDDTPSTAGECQTMVAEASGLADSYDSLYNDA
jgi:hypothetical protein